MLRFHAIVTYKSKPAENLSVIQDEHGLRDVGGSKLTAGCLNWLLKARPVWDFFSSMGYNPPPTQLDKDITDVVYNFSLIKEGLFINESSLDNLTAKQRVNFSELLSEYKQFLELFDFEVVSVPETPQPAATELNHPVVEAAKPVLPVEEQQSLIPEEVAQEPEPAVQATSEEPLQTPTIEACVEVQAESAPEALTPPADDPSEASSEEMAEESSKPKRRKKPKKDAE